MRELEQRDGHRRSAFYELATARDRGPQIAGEIQAEDILQHRIQADETLWIIGLGVTRRGRNDCARITDAVQTLECVCSLGPALPPPTPRPFPPTRTTCKPGPASYSSAPPFSGVTRMVEGGRGAHPRFRFADSASK